MRSLTLSAFLFVSLAQAAVTVPMTTPSVAFQVPLASSGTTPSMTTATCARPVLLHAESAQLAVPGKTALINFETSDQANATFTWTCNDVKHAVSWPVAAGQYVVLVQAEDLEFFKAARPDVSVLY